MSTWNHWDGPEEYVWVVICKNHKFHKQKNLFSGHKIPLAETDAIEMPPNIEGNLRVRCDNCGEEHSYLPNELLRIKMEISANFQPHPLFS